jgi:hypothetical protein
MKFPSRVSTLASILCLAHSEFAQAQAVLRTVNGPSQLGRDVGFVGDLDGDAFPETFALGTPTQFGTWPVLLINGRTGFVSLTQIPNVIELEVLGDLDGDGTVETLRSYSGGRDVHSPIDGPMRFNLPPGTYVAVGDVNGDGVKDIAGHFGSNFIQIYSGANGVVVGGAGGLSDATIVCDWGDLNADGKDDYLMASSAISPQSGASVRSGANGSAIGSLPFSALLGASYLGRVDADQFAEIVVYTSAGTISVVSGSTFQPLYSLSSFGSVVDVCAAGDVDQDGATDFASMVQSVAPATRRITVHSGRDGSPIAIYSSLYATSIDAGADVNRDGFPDVVVGEAAASAGPVGSSRVVFVSGAPTPPLTYCQGKINSLGCEPYVWASGSTSRSGPDNLVVHAANVLNNKLGIMFWGRQGSSAPFLGGTLCISTPFKRTDSQSSAGTAQGSDCSGTFSYAFSQAEMAQNGLGVGSAGYCQFWYRDPGFPPPANVGLTNGVVFTVSF